MQPRPRRVRATRPLKDSSTAATSAASFAEHPRGSELAEVEGMQTERVVHGRARSIRTDRDDRVRAVEPLRQRLQRSQLPARRPPGGGRSRRRSVASRSGVRRARRCRPRPCAPWVAPTRPRSSSRRARARSTSASGRGRADRTAGPVAPDPRGARWCDRRSSVPRVTRPRRIGARAISSPRRPPPRR